MTKNKKVKYPKENIVVVTIDSLRYDVAKKAKTPNLKSLFKEYGISKKWVKVGSQGTYTLPSHISMFHAGHFPCDNRNHIPGPFNRNKERLFKAQLAWERTTIAKFPTPPTENVVKGFEKLGYRTVGVGGVSWFNDKFESSKFWGKYYFKEFYWNDKFREKSYNSIIHQIKTIKKFKLKTQKKPTFLFLNVSMTHDPYLGFGRSKKGQKKALEEFDKHLFPLLETFPRNYHLFILSDHGECFGEQGLWGHGFYHPKVMEIPFNYVIV